MTGELLHSLHGIRINCDCLVSHPMHSNIILSADFSGSVILWDIDDGSKVFSICVLTKAEMLTLALVRLFLHLSVSNL